MSGRWLRGGGVLAAARSVISSWLPGSLTRHVGGWVRRVTRRPPVGRVAPERLWDTSPVSRDWGFDRGKPIDRHYIERFLAGRADDVHGRVLEIDTDRYTRAFGGDRVRRSDVLALDPDRAGATLTGDLADGSGLPAEAFDCAIVTQTLQLIYQVGVAVEVLHRILKPGGVALVTVPGISKMTVGEDDSWGYCWGFTSRSARLLFEERFSEGRVEVETFGNVLAAVAFLHGIAAEELDPSELEQRDPDYEVLVAIRARKGPAARMRPGA